MFFTQPVFDTNHRQYIYSEEKKMVETRTFVVGLKKLQKDSSSLSDPNSTVDLNVVFQWNC
jgi:hypothetical protein